MRRDLKVYLDDIAESISKIEAYVKNASESGFCRNTQVQDAVLRRLEIIGEAVKNVPLDIRGRHPQVPWKKIAGMRDVFIHAYSRVNMKRVWKVIKEDMVGLKQEIRRIKRGL